jgi:PAS domain S-box-containing protein
MPEQTIGTRIKVRFIRGWLWRGLAVVSEVAVAFAARELVAHHQPRFAPFITFYPAVLLASLLDGVWAGAAVTVLSTLVAEVFVFAPLGKFAVSDPYDVLSLLIFLAFGISLSVVIELYHRNREKLAAWMVEEAVSREHRRREEEQKLARSVQAERQRLYDVLETLPSMVSLLRPDHRVAFANRSFREKFGQPGDQRCFEMRFGRSEPCQNCETFLPLTTGQPSQREVAFPDQTLMEAFDFPFKDLDGTSLILEMGNDITARRRVEQELTKHQERLEELVAERTQQLAEARLHAERVATQLRTIFESVEERLYVCDRDGNAIMANGVARSTYGGSPVAPSVNEMSGLIDVFDLAGHQLALPEWPISRVLRGERLHSVEVKVRFKAINQERILSCNGSAIRDQSGEILMAVLTSSDITERLRTEKALRESEKMALQREQFQALAERLRRAREEERTRVARDLHDQIGQILTAIKLDLTWMSRRLPQGNDEFQDRMKGAIGLINDGVQSVRRICSGLRPAVLDDLGLAAAIEWQAGEFATRTGIHCAVTVPATDLSLDGDTATAFFRIFQECLTNVMRHAQAGTVRVALNEQDGDLVLVVADDGKGLRESDLSGSLGFLGMKERAQVCGGNLEVSSSPGNGTTVTLRVPMHSARSRNSEYAHSDSR